MTARVRALVGLLIIGGCLLFAFWALFDLVRFGSCASGGPYVSARECAPGTGWKIMGMIASVFGVLIGVGIAGSARAGLAAWGLGFTGLAATFALASFGPAAGPDNMPGMGIGMGAMFGLMGLPGLVAAMSPKSQAERRGIKLQGPYGTGVTVRQQSDGGPAPIVLADTPVDLQHHAHHSHDWGASSSDSSGWGSSDSSSSDSSSGSSFSD